MSIEQKIEGNIGKLFLSGEIDLDGSPEVRENIKDLIDKVNIIEVQSVSYTHLTLPTKRIV